VLPTGNSTWGVLDTVCTLRGNVLGEIPKALNSVSALSASHGSIRVRCALLARVDFAAAGEILNWTVARAEHGNYVEFEGVSHLIAALFKMVGLDKFAKISVRTR
jgi:ABC-type transporter Mla MlaB component